MIPRLPVQEGIWPAHKDCDQRWMEDARVVLEHVDHRFLYAPRGSEDSREARRWVVFVVEPESDVERKCGEATDHRYELALRFANAGDRHGDRDGGLRHRAGIGGGDATGNLALINPA